jgi:hypothetical protein
LQPPSSTVLVVCTPAHPLPSPYESGSGKHEGCWKPHVHAHAFAPGAGSTMTSVDVEAVGHVVFRSAANKTGKKPAGAPHAPASHDGPMSSETSVLASVVTVRSSSPEIIPHPTKLANANAMPHTIRIGGRV